MGIYNEFSQRLNTAAKTKSSIEGDLLRVADAFAREIDRVWEGGGKVRYGIVSPFDKFEPSLIGPLSKRLSSEFVIAFEFEIELMPTIKTFPVTVARVADGIILSVREDSIHYVDVDQPALFIPALSELHAIVDSWVQSEAQKNKV